MIDMGELRIAKALRSWAGRDFANRCVVWGTQGPTRMDLVHVDPSDASPDNSIEGARDLDFERQETRQSVGIQKTQERISQTGGSAE